MKTILVSVLGVGKVGLGLLETLQKNSQRYASRLGIAFDVTAIFDSTGLLLKSNGPIDPYFLKNAINWKRSGAKFITHPSAVSFSGSSLAINPESILVDCSASSETLPVILFHLKQGGRVVLANKKPLTESIATFHELMRHSKSLRFESTCGAGTPFINTTQRILNSGDNIHSIKGCFSGTLGFITTQLSTTATMSSLLSKAIEKGFTEPDPRDDLSGVDVARKALILARLTGQNISFSDMSIEPLFPSELAKCSTGEFLRRFPDFDQQYLERVRAAETRKAVLRYVADITPNSVSVGLQEVPLESPMGQLKGTDNFMQVTSDIYTSPLIIQGAGAGVDVTVSGIVADMIRLAHVN